MPNTVILVRHGQAAPRGTHEDMDRVLTKLGTRLLQQNYPETFAQYKGQTDIEIWASPAQRAFETAEIIADALDANAEDIVQHDELYNYDARAVLNLMEHSKARTLVVVTHIPLVDSLAYALAGEFFEFNPGAAAFIRLSSGVHAPGELLRFVPGPENHIHT